MNTSKAYELEHGTDIRPAHHRVERAKYIFVLDFMDGQVYRYDIRSVSMNEEEYLMSQGHSLANIEWMSTDNPEIITD